MPEEVNGLGTATTDTTSKESGELGEHKEDLKTDKKQLTKEELDDQSRLGRRLKKLEELELERKERDQKILDKLEALSTVGSRTVQPPVESNEPQYISTAEDVERFLEIREQKKAKAQEEARSKYAKQYVAKLRELGEEDPEVHEEIFALCTEENAPFNKFRTGQGDVDAELNYEKARASFYAKKSGKVKIPGRKEVATSSTNVSTRSTSESSSPPPVELDDEARDFLKRRGKDEKWAAEVLGSPGKK